MNLVIDPKTGTDLIKFNETREQIRQKVNSCFLQKNQNLNTISTQI